MSIPVSSILSAVSAATLAGTLLSSGLWAEPLNTARLTLAANPSAWTPTTKQFFARQIRGAETVRSGSIASAVRPLDLRKLTMADFGDVEGRR